MPSDAAELSSIVSAVSDLETRITDIIGHHEGTPREDLVSVLYEAERALRSAVRAVERAARLAP
jgi:hypothetical protein